MMWFPQALNARRCLGETGLRAWARELAQVSGKARAAGRGLSGTKGVVWAQSSTERPQNCGQRCEWVRRETSPVLPLWLVSEHIGPWGLHSGKGSVFWLANEGSC